MREAVKEDAALLDAVAGQESRPERTDFLFYTVVYAFNDSKERGLQLAIMKVPKTKNGSRCLIAELATLLMVAECKGVVRVIDHCSKVSARDCGLCIRALMIVRRSAISRANLSMYQ